MPSRPSSTPDELLVPQLEARSAGRGAAGGSGVRTRARRRAAECSPVEVATDRSAVAQQAVVHVVLQSDREASRSIGLSKPFFLRCTTSCGQPLRQRLLVQVLPGRPLSLKRGGSSRRTRPGGSPGTAREPRASSPSTSCRRPSAGRPAGWRGCRCRASATADRVLRRRAAAGRARPWLRRRPVRHRACTHGWNSRSFMSELKNE